MDPAPRHDERFDVRFEHRVRFVPDAWDPACGDVGELVEPIEGRAARVLVVLDSGLGEADPGYAGRIEAYAGAHASRIDCVGIEIVPGGETCKGDHAVVDRVLELINRGGLCRRSYVIAVGGGAVLDAAGYAASIAHRGVRLIRVPTTTLAQGDSGVGVKNGINAFGKKNFLGVFAVPWGVVNDERSLLSLSDRDWRCGFVEAVKVGLVRDAALFESVERSARSVVERDMGVSMPIIRRSADLHLRHITSGGDPFELTRARPLDFGHWSAHKLEQLSGYEIRHGEAVAIGIALDCAYAERIGILDAETGERVRVCLLALGFELKSDLLGEDLMAGVEEFREHLGGGLAVPLIRGVGETVDAHEIDRSAMMDAMGSLAG